MPWRHHAPARCAPHSDIIVCFLFYFAGQHQLLFIFACSCLVVIACVVASATVTQLMQRQAGQAAGRLPA